MTLLVRIFGWFQRFTNCIVQLGLINSLKLFIIGRVTKKDLSLKLPNGQKFKANGALDLVTSHFHTLGYYIETERDSEIQCIVDAGANIGVETARFSHHYPHAQVVAIEANKRNFDLLTSNFKNNPNVSPIHAAVWPIKSGLSLKSTGTDMQMFKVYETDGSATDVEPISVNDILLQFHFSQIDIFKLDIEGAELDLFTRGDTTWIDKVNAFIIEIGDQDAAGMTQSIFRAIDAHDFNCFLCGENLVMIRAHLGWKLERIYGFKTAPSDWC